MSLKVSISGIRGIVGESLTPEVILNYTLGFSKILENGAILIARDSRLSGEAILNLVKGALNLCGRDVVDIGIAPTPVVLFGVANNKKIAGGIVITASHNPEQWNALKLVNGNGKFISQIELDKINEFISKKDFTFAYYKNIGKCYFDDSIINSHKNRIFDFIDIDKIYKKKIKVAIDTVNGACGNYAIEFLKDLGCEVFPINTEPTGIFSHPAEPNPENLKELSAMCKYNKVDMGFGLDPDGDRVVIVDEKGDVLSEELTLAIAVKHYLENYKKTNVVINLSSSRIVEDIANEYGASLFRAKTGEINVTEMMEKLDATIGGEGNGGVILFDINKCRDAFVAMALTLDYFAKRGINISTLNKELSRYVLLKEKFEIKDIDFNIIENKIKEIYSNEKIDTTDGIRVDFKDSWVLIRKSNTEPIIRVFVEAKTEKDAKELIKKIKELIDL
ncbi:MAG TPA: phosphoglucosamine mutase [Spirochaetota bacterium]|nr:phosphoglucosamine mutase [Spirochaetota bacterium]HOL56497.1 phosphoglucosamine mutase [Spirochaetota bacterium]HPP03961.1 phosphoglucosamine mutase [Spirochaetota bacterium]